jgi:nicotinate phosphoribosyltransferase
MQTLPRPDRRCSTLLTDLYQLTMAYGYWKTGTHSKEAVFHLFFRSHPFKGGFSIACGLSDAIDYLRALAFDEEELAYLGALTGNDGEALFEPGFIDYLRTMKWSCDVDGIPEGTIVFPHEPLLRVQGPIIQCQLIETALLNLLNFQTLIATKAARVCLAAQGDPVIEFGLRRAQGVDGALAASRAAFVGGCTATSNVQAGHLFGIPIRGTHGHSWVMSFDTEEDAFRAYAEAMPNNAVFLVDTYDTLQGVERAIEMGRWLRERGHEMAGVRLDSGDLAWLSIEARRLLDAAGFPKAAVVATNDLDEYTITSLKQQGAAISVWGVGTRLVTAYDQPALGGVYKLAAVRESGEAWHHKIKLSEQVAKVSTPGLQQVRRFRRDGRFEADMIFDLDGPCEAGRAIVDRTDATRRKTIPEDADYEDLLVPIFRRGQLVYTPPPLAATRERTQAQLRSLHEGHKRFLHPHEYPVGLSPALHNRRTELILAAREPGPITKPLKTL